MRQVLVTGVTGFIGSVLCKRLLEEKENYLYLLSRGKGNLSAEKRIFTQLEKSTGESADKWKDRICVLEGDLCHENFGLTSRQYKELTEKIQTIYHCAASIKFSLPYEEAKKINCFGTEQIVKLAEQADKTRFDRINYVSTSYIAGNILKGFAEYDLDCDQNFNNTYEQTKYECEMFLNDAIRRGIPITIYRPSVVTGDSRDGSTHKNNIIYKFIKMIQLNAVKDFYCEDDTSINMVPVDYVVDGILSLSRMKNANGNTYHLVNAVNTNIKESVKTVCRYLDLEMPNYLPFSEIKHTEPDHLYHFFNYARLSHHFKNDISRDILNSFNLHCEPLGEDYFHKNLEYCIQQGLLKGVVRN